MKRLLTLLLLIVAIRANAQTKVKSKLLADSIWLQKGAYEVPPSFVAMASDTARSFSYAISFSRDTTGVVSATSTVYNKSGAPLKSETTTFAASKYKKWLPLINAMDAYIQTVYTRLTKQ